VHMLESRHYMVVYSILDLSHQRSCPASFTCSGQPVMVCTTLTASHLGTTASWLAAQPEFGINALVRIDPFVPGGASARLEEVRSDSFGAEKMLAKTITKFLAKVLIGPSRCSITHTQQSVVSVVRVPDL